MTRHTHTYVILEVAPETWSDIYVRLTAVGEWETYYDAATKLIVFGTVALKEKK